tara:strand:+ start:590 stop:1024 length:435 start_codon:yes stop_codon:yes gene_type:complete
MAGFTNKGKAKILRAFFQSESMPTYLYIYLVTATNVPDADTNTLSELTEITETGKEVLLQLNTTDFDTSTANTEDDAGDRGVMQIKDINITGAITAASYVVLTDDNVTEADREVWAFWSLGSVRSITATETLRISNLEFNLLNN